MDQATHNADGLMDWLKTQLFDLVPEAIVILDAKGRILDVNVKLKEWLGYEKTEIQGKLLVNLPFLPPKSKLSVVEKFTQRMLGGEVSPYQIEMVAKDGRRLFVNIRGNLVEDPETKQKIDMAICSEVTDLKEAEEVVRRRGEVLEAGARAAESLLGGDYAYWEGLVSRVITELGKQLGVGRIAFYKNIRDGELVRARLRYEWKQGEETCRVFEDEGELIECDRQGLSRWKELFLARRSIYNTKNDLPEEERNTRVLTDKMQSFIAIPIYVGDEWWGFVLFVNWEQAERWVVETVDAFKSMALTFGAAIQRKRTESRVEWFRMGLERSYDIAFMTDLAGMFTYVNSAFTTLYGYDLEEIQGKTPRILKSGVQDQEFYTHFWQTLTQGSVVSEELVNKTRDGRQVTMEATVSPIMDTQGKPVGYMAIQRDISDRLEKSSKLEEKQHELERINKLMVGREVRMAEMKEKLKRVGGDGGSDGAEEVARNGDVVHDEGGVSTVRAVMSTPVVTIEPGTSLLEAAKLMAKHQIGALVVTLEKSEFGVITERDFLRFVSEGKRRPDEALVAEVMSAPAVTVPSFETIEAASKILEERAFRRLPVVDEGRLVGMVTLTSLMSALRSRVIAELETRFAELEKTNRLMVGRELRMVELKKQLQTRTPADAGGGKQ